MNRRRVRAWALLIALLIIIGFGWYAIGEAFAPLITQLWNKL